MRFFSFNTSLSSAEINERFLRYLENEKHSSLDIFTEYYSSRRGLHLYPTHNGFAGYFESGERNRHGMLQRAKVWTRFSVKEKKNKKVITGNTYFCPLFSIFLFLGATEIIIFKDTVSLCILLLVLSILLFETIRIENEILEHIKNMIKD